MNSQIVVGYVYGSYSSYPHELIEYNCLTHIAHAFIIPDSSGRFHYYDWFLYPELIQSAHGNGKKIVISIGGWGNSDGFKPFAKSPSKRKLFISELVKFIKLYGYDGADIDWEYPKAEDKENFTALITEMRAAFDSAGIEILSAALPAIDWNNVFDVSILKDKLTWFGIMTYDFYGPWEKTTGHNTALYSTGGQGLSIDNSIKHYLAKGVPIEKLCMGMEFAGYCFKSAGLYKTHTGGSSISYTKALDSLKKNWEYHWDERAKVPYFIYPDSGLFMTIDDTSSIRYKSEYISATKLGGTIIWKLGLDYHNNYNKFMNIIGDYYLSAPAGIPVPVTPANNEFTDHNNIVFRWERPYGAGSYEIEISESPEFNKSNLLLTSQGQNYTEVTLEPFNIYYWRIRNRNISGISSWSDVNSFSTYKDSALLADKLFSHFPEYPSSETALIYRVSIPSSVSIKMHNVFGEEISTIVNGTKENGIYSDRIKLGEYPEGTYYIGYRSGDDIRRMRMYFYTPPAPLQRGAGKLL